MDMKPPHLRNAALALAVTGIAAAIFWQQQRINRLTVDAAILREQLAQAAPLSEENDRLAEQLRTATNRVAEQTEEPLLGADGGILITISTPEERVEKAVLFQAKKFPQRRQSRSLTIPKREASRLKKQVKTMVKVSEESIVIGHTRQGIYALDAETLEDLTVENLRHPLETPRLLGIGTFLGKWVARCSRGDLSDSVIRIVLTPRGLLRHQLVMNIETKQRPLLTDGGSPTGHENLTPDQMPIPRWRMRY